MRVAVIGAGAVGVTSAYFLAQNGHQVSVIERHGNVCEQASLGHAGLLGAGHLMPLAAPGMARQIASQWFRANTAVQFPPRQQLSYWRWLRSWIGECELDRMLANQRKMQRLGQYGLALLSDLTVAHQLDFQQRSGVLHLFRQPRDLSNASAGLDLLKQADIAHQVLDEAGCRQREIALNPTVPIAGGLYFPNDGQGNCVLFAKQLKTIMQQNGVEFRFQTDCRLINGHQNGVTLQLMDRHQSASHVFDAVVVATGADSLHWFDSLGIPLRAAPILSVSCTANLKNPEDSPGLSVVDASRQVVMTRMDKRIRVAGTVRLGNNVAQLRPSSWQLLRDTAGEWFPNAANYASGLDWSGQHLMVPDNAPVLGPTVQPNVYINAAHAETGWAMAVGAGKVLADQLSGRTVDIDVTGLGITRQTGHA